MRNIAPEALLQAVHEVCGTYLSSMSHIINLINVGQLSDCYLETYKQSLVIDSEYLLIFCLVIIPLLLGSRVSCIYKC